MTSRRCAGSLGVVAFLFVVSIASAVGASSPDGVWSDVAESAIPAGGGGTRLIVPKVYRTVILDTDALFAILAGAPMEKPGGTRTSPVVLSLPLPSGGYGRFRIERSPIVEPELAAQFPEIQTFRGQGIDDVHASVRFDRTPAGFHALILSDVSGSIFIDPYRRGDAIHHIAYFDRDFAPPPGKAFRCQVVPPGSSAAGGNSSPVEGTKPGKITSGGLRPNAASGATLRSYRVAIAATGEYTAFHGGTVANGLAAITTTLNRVNGVYEKEVAIRMILVANNNLIVYTNGATDPYTNNDGFAMLGENQTNLDTVIGSANYDIGHVLSTGGGGVAGLGVPCQAGWKAEGVTGSGAPIGDPFDIDYVAHEMGHQWGGNHTFNGTTGACGGGNRNASTAYEPGSASTIQGYAGICGAEDLQPNSDAYFHTISFDEIVAYSTSVACSTNAATGNGPPTVNAGSSYTIPRSTPFTLTGSASDPNSDPLTYCWEEFDLGTAAPPNTDNGNRPIFRSFTPVASGSRTFPRLSDILSGTSTFGESLPTTNRTMTFRLTARDNRAGGGGVNYSSTTVTVNSAAGPFAVTAPNTAVTWQPSGSSQTVTWNVAGTSGAPVNCANVNILLSTDGGNTFPTTLVAATPNDGSQSVTTPAVNTSQARVKVECAGNIFFDISNTNFFINILPVEILTFTAE